MFAQSHIERRGLLGCVVWLCSISTSAAWVEQPPIDTLRVESQGGVDENLFLMRHLEHTLMGWKPPTASADELHTWIVSTRDRLIGLRKYADFHKLDKDVIEDYDDVLALLERYDEFLKDNALGHLVSAVNAPAGTSRAELLNSTLAGAANGVTVGAVIGTFTLPLVGTIGAAGTLGAVGGLAGGASWLANYQESERRMAVIEKAQERHLNGQIDRLNSHIGTVSKGLTTDAKLLAGRYGWGTEVGFDGSTHLPYEEQLKLRPRDPFLLVTIALSDPSADPKLRALRCLAAARLVPPDRAPTIDVYDTFRASFLLIGGRICCTAAYDESGTHDKQLAEGANRFFKTAICCLNTEIPFADQFSFANSLAYSGRLLEADAAFDQISRNVAYHELLTYDHARVASRLGRTEKASKLLKWSFQLNPRWEPYILEDPEFSNLIRANGAEISQLCKSPIVGKWQVGVASWLEFFPNGQLLQTASTSRSRTYSVLDDNKMQLTRSDGSEELTNYRFHNDNRLQIVFTETGKTIDCTRCEPSLIGKWGNGANYSIEFLANGLYIQAAARARRGRFSVISCDTLRIATEDVLTGKRLKVFGYAAEKDKLRMTSLETGEVIECTRQY